VNSTAVITLSETGARKAILLVKALGTADLYVHKLVPARYGGRRFSTVQALTHRIFHRYKNLVYILPTGVVVRSIDGLLKGKLVDPAVVVLDVGARYAISLLSGHEGGANKLALQAGNILAAEPVITTTTDAEKTLIVGIGCRRGAAAKDIVTAIRTALRKVKATPDRVRLIATADIKHDEAGLIEAAEILGIGLRLVTSEEIRSTAKQFKHTPLAIRKVGLPAVAEPAALLAGRRTQLILNKTIIRQVTVAIARENCL
jgi:cobalt-precorrin 5A hydrolase